MTDSPESRMARFEAVLDHIRIAVDRLSDQMASVGQIQAQAAHDREAIARAFKRIEALDERLDKLVREDAEAHRNIADTTNLLNTRMRVYVGIIVGVGFGAAAVWGALAWTIKNDVVHLLKTLNGAGG